MLSHLTYIINPLIRGFIGELLRQSQVKSGLLKSRYARLTSVEGLQGAGARDKGGWNQGR